MNKYRLRSIWILFIIIFFCAINTNAKSYFPEEKTTKTLIIVLDDLDFSIVENIINDKLSLGLMSIKVSGLYNKVNKESLFMTMASGRRVKVKEGLYGGIKKIENNYLLLEGYDVIINDLNNKYNKLLRENMSLGESLIKNNIKAGLLGSGPSAMLIADNKGRIQSGLKEINYNEKWLKETTEELFNTVDLLVVSYNTYRQQDRINILKKYIEEFNDYHLFIFPEKLSDDISYRFNTTIIPLIYGTGSGETGILTSNTTRREGIITSLDIRPSIEHIYGIKTEGAIGNNINIIKSTNMIQKNKNNLLEFLNLNIIKYIFHGYIIAAEFYVVYSCVFKRKKIFKKYNTIMTSVLLCIILSLIFGMFNLHRHIIIYLAIIIFMSLFISKTLINKVTLSFTTISIGTNILILIGVFFNIDIIYNSFIGYNNIIAGGRFYGFNNEIMGVLLATSIISFYELKKHMSTKWSILYFPLTIIALSGRFGANIGGYITSVLAFLILIYINCFKGNKGKKVFIVLLVLGVAILVLNLFFDINNVDTSHGGRFIERFMIFGFNELFAMVFIKLKQLILMSILPPWSIIFISQMYFIRDLFKNENGYLYSSGLDSVESFDKCCIIFIISLIAFIINDTGVVAFTYVNTYLIAYIINVCEVKISLDGDD